MPRGSKPGERRGGRKKGVPGRTTVAIEEVAKKHGLITRPGQKLVKDELLKVFEICLGMAARYQPRPDQDSPTGNLAEFKEWIRISIECGKAIMPYQSPTFRAIVVAPAPDSSKGDDATRFTLKIFESTTGRDVTPGAKKTIN
jgi:hypothetical protein